MGYFGLRSDGVDSLESVELGLLTEFDVVIRLEPGLGCKELVCRYVELGAESNCCRGIGTDVEFSTDITRSSVRTDKGSDCIETFSSGCLVGLRKNTNFGMWHNQNRIEILKENLKNYSTNLIAS